MCRTLHSVPNASKIPIVFDNNKKKLRLGRFEIIAIVKMC